MSLSLQNCQRMPETNTRNCTYRSTFLRPNVCEKKFTSYRQVLKDANKKLVPFLLPHGVHIHLCSLVRNARMTTETTSSAIAEGRRDASCQLKSCQLLRNSAETTCTTSPEQIEVMKLKSYIGAMCNKHVHSTMTRSSRFHCPVGNIYKPTTLWISPVYRQLAVAKFSESTMEKLLT